MPMLTPAMAEILLMVIKAGKFAVKQIGLFNLDELEPGQKEAIMAERDELNKELNRLDSLGR